MRDEDDIQHNINFCVEVQQYEHLYDYPRTGYCLFNRTLQDESWESIAQIFKSNSSECKQRWKNIRASYSNYMRKLKTFGHGKVEEYDLAPYLSFLDPFLKTRKTKDKSVEKTVDESLVKTEPQASECEDNCESVLPDDYLSVRNSQSFAPPPPSNYLDKKPPSQIKACKETRRRYPSFTFKKDVNPRVYHSAKTKQQLLQIQNLTDAINQIDPDLGLLQSSVRPDMKFMNTTQKKNFILDLAGQILATNEITATTSMKLKVESP